MTYLFKVKGLGHGLQLFLQIRLYLSYTLSSHLRSIHRVKNEL